MRPKVIECGACGHADNHCLASGCNHATSNEFDCDCEKFVPITETELMVLESVVSLSRKNVNLRVRGQALSRLVRKGSLERRLENGQLYQLTEAGRAVLLGCPPDILHDLLGLVTERPPTIGSLAKLTRDERELLRDWAAREHLSASDNIVRRRKRPDFLNSLLD